MSKYTRIILLFSTCIIAIMTGCEPPQTQAAVVENKSVPKIQHRNVWNRLNSTFEFNHPHEHPTVSHYIKRYSKQKHYVTAMSNFASPYLFHVVEELERRNMPGEIALLPMIESEFRPHARSHAGALGVWQIESVTGRHYGLKSDYWYDGRLDFDAATEAALSHLQFLHKKFDGDWFLALAAYNCGGGCVSKAIRKNRKAGLPTDYWNLHLPKETKHFVPKLLALSHMVKNPELFELELAPIENQPYFTRVNTGQQIDFEVAAQLAGMPAKEIRRLNSGFLRHTTHPKGPHVLLLPTQNAKLFQESIDEYRQSEPLVRTTQHVIRNGDTLSKIAQKYRVSVFAIKQANKMTSDIIISGRKITIPLYSRVTSSIQAASKPPTQKT